MFMKIIVRIRKCVILVIIQLNQNIVVSKMKGETGGVAIEGFIRLKPKLYSFLVDYSSWAKKTKGVKKNVIATLCQGEYKYILLNNKCLRGLMKRII